MINWDKYIMLELEGREYWFNFEEMSFREKSWGKFTRDFELSIYKYKKKDVKMHAKYRVVDRDLTKSDWRYFADDTQEIIVQAFIKWQVDRAIERMLE